MRSRFWLRFGGYRCQKCHRMWSGKDVIFSDDPMAPFGPEWLCPNCESFTELVLTKLGVIVAISIVVAVGLTVGYFNLK